MNIKKFTQNIILLILSNPLIVLISFWGAINITPDDVINKQSFFSIRLLIPLFLSLIFLFNYKNYRALNEATKLLILLQVVTIIGVFSNINYLYNLYWPIILIGYILFSSSYAEEIIIYNEKIIFIIFLISLFYVIYVLYKYKIINAYEVNNLSGEVLGMPMSRSTGIARLAGLCMLYAVFRLSADVSINYLKYLLIAICVLLLCMLNTRGAVLSTALSLFIFLTLNKDLKFSIKILMLIILSYFIYLFIVYIYSISIDVNLIPESIKHIDGVSRIVGNDVSSGRYNIWLTIFQQHNEIGFFGFGSLADKILIGQNASGSLAYIFVSSGLIGLIIYILFNIKIFSKIFNEISSINRNYINILVVIVYFSSRAIYENSFTIFSIDALIYIPYIILLFKK